MKKLILILALVLSAVALLIPAQAPTAPTKVKTTQVFNDRYCTTLNDPCVGPFNYYNHHYVYNYGPNQAFCGSYTPNGTQQGSAFVDPGQEKTISAWNYNHSICWNLGGSHITLHIIGYS